jgi:mycothiol maleylpyruvate isomerase-like protein
VHDIAAHLAGNSSEIARIVEAYAEGREVPETQPWDVREARFRELDHAKLLRSIVDETERMNRVLSSVLSAEPDATVPWTHRQMSVKKFGTHMRTEFALHRWDVIGDDDASLQLLSQPELTHHAIDVLGAILPRRGFEGTQGVPKGFSALAQPRRGGCRVIGGQRCCPATHGCRGFRRTIGRGRGWCRAIAVHLGPTASGRIAVAQPHARRRLRVGGATLRGLLTLVG